MGSLFGIPGMLAWGGAAAIPILIHLFTRQRYKRVSWAAMDFLLRAFKKTRRRIRLEHLILLFLRMAAILLFAISLANPLLNPASLLGGSDTRRQAVVVLDDSFSMGLAAPDGSTPFGRAVEQTRRLINSLSRERGDTITLITASRPVRLLRKGEADPGAALEEIERLELGDGATDLPGAFGAVLAILDDLEEGAEVIVLSDFQRVALVPGDSGDPAAASPGELSSLIQQIVAKKAIVSWVKPRDAVTDNLGVVDVTSRSKVVVAGTPTVISVAVRNFGSRPQGGAVNLYVDGSSEPADQREIDVIPPGQTATVDFRVNFRDPGSHFVEARFFADNLEVDNRRMLSLEVRGRVRVLCVDGNPGEEPSEWESYFFAAALNPGGDEESESVFEVETVEEIRFDRTELKNVDLLVLMNVALVSARRAEEIERFVAEGGALLVFLGSRTQPQVLNQRLFKSGAGVLPAEIIEDSGPPPELSVYYTLTVQDYAHPAMSYFDDPGLRQLITLSPVQRFYRVKIDHEDPRVQTLITMDREIAAVTTPHPTLIERRFGRGRTMLFTTSGGDPEWNSLPALGTYVILNREIVQYLTRRDLKLENLLAGDTYSRLLRSFASEVVMSRDGRQIEVLTPLALEGEQGRELKSGILDRSGVYRFDLKIPGNAAPDDPNPIFVSVNLDPVESDLARVDESFIRSAFPSDSVRVVEGTEDSAEGHEGRRKGRGWWWALLAAGICLALETALSQIFGVRAGREG